MAEDARPNLAVSQQRGAASIPIIPCSPWLSRPPFPLHGLLTLNPTDSQLHVSAVKGFTTEQSRGERRVSVGGLAQLLGMLLLQGCGWVGLGLGEHVYFIVPSLSQCCEPFNSPHPRDSCISAPSKERGQI